MGFFLIRSVRAFVSMYLSRFLVLCVEDGFSGNHPSENLCEFDALMAKFLTKVSLLSWSFGISDFSRFSM